MFKDKHVVNKHGRLSSTSARWQKQQVSVRVNTKESAMKKPKRLAVWKEMSFYAWMAYQDQLMRRVLINSREMRSEWICQKQRQMQRESPIWRREEALRKVFLPLLIIAEIRRSPAEPE